MLDPVNVALAVVVGAYIVAFLTLKRKGYLDDRDD